MDRSMGKQGETGLRLPGRADRGAADDALVPAGAGDEAEQCAFGVELQHLAEFQVQHLGHPGGGGLQGGRQVGGTHGLQAQPCQHFLLAHAHGQTGFAHAQGLLPLVVLDRQPHQVGGVIDQFLVLAAWQARLALVDGEGRQHPAVGVQDRRRPAGAQPLFLDELACEFAVVRPEGILTDVGNPDGLFVVGGGSAGTRARADGQAVKAAVVRIRQMGGGPVAQTPARRIQQHHGGDPVVHDALDAEHGHLQHGGQRQSRGNGLHDLRIQLLQALRPAGIPGGCRRSGASLGGGGGGLAAGIHLARKRRGAVGTGMGRHGGQSIPALRLGKPFNFGCGDCARRQSAGARSPRQGSSDRVQ